MKQFDLHADAYNIIRHKIDYPEKLFRTFGCCPRSVSNMTQRWILAVGMVYPPHDSPAILLMSKVLTWVKT